MTPFYFLCLSHPVDAVPPLHEHPPFPSKALLAPRCSVKPRQAQQCLGTPHISLYTGRFQDRWRLPHTPERVLRAKCPVFPSRISKRQAQAFLEETELAALPRASRPATAEDPICLSAPAAFAGAAVNRGRCSCSWASPYRRVSSAPPCSRASRVGVPSGPVFLGW